MINQPVISLKGHIKSSILLGVPLVGAQLAQMLITVVDTIMLGWLGVEELAAGTLAGQIFFLFLIFGIGFGAAVVPLVASALGRGEPREVRRSTRMGLWVLFAMSIIFMGPLWFIEEILVLLGQKPELAVLAGEYMAIAQWSLIPGLLLIVLRNFLTALERAQVIMWFTFVTAAVNALLNYALIFGNFGAPRLEMEGAAIATVIANIFAFVITAIFVLRDKKSAEFQIFQNIWRPDWQAFEQIFKLGITISFTILAEVGLFAASTIMIGWLGTTQLAAHGIALQIASMAFMVPLGLSQVATVRIGNAYGRKDNAAITAAAQAVVILAMVFALISALLLFVIPEAMIGLFLDFDNPNAPAVLNYAVILLGVAAIFQIVDGLQAVVLGALRGMSDTAVPLIYAVISYWPVGVLSAWVLGFPLGYGGAGVWAGLALGLTSASILLVYRFWKRERLGLLPN